MKTKNNVFTGVNASSYVHNEIIYLEITWKVVFIKQYTKFTLTLMVYDGDTIPHLFEGYRDAHKLEVTIPIPHQQLGTLQL